MKVHLFVCVRECVVCGQMSVKGWVGVCVKGRGFFTILSQFSPSAVHSHRLLPLNTQDHRDEWTNRRPEPKAGWDFSRGKTFTINVMHIYVQLNGLIVLTYQIVVSVAWGSVICSNSLTLVFGLIKIGWCYAVSLLGCILFSTKRNTPLYVNVLSCNINLGWWVKPKGKFNYNWNYK